MTDLDRFSLVAAEETENADACPECGCTMKAHISHARVLRMWFCKNCDKYRPKGNDNGNILTR
jgi:hypothetical protein